MLLQKLADACKNWCGLLCILTSKQVLGIPFVGQNNLFSIFPYISVTYGKKVVSTIVVTLQPGLGWKVTEVFILVVYFGQRTHACACVCMVENNQKHSKMTKKYFFIMNTRGLQEAYVEKWRKTKKIVCWSAIESDS